MYIPNPLYLILADYATCGDDPYICCIYFISGSLNGANFGDIKPRQVSELIISISVTYMAQYFFAYFLSESGAMIQNLTETLVNFDYDVAVVKVYDMIVTKSIIV